MMLFPKNRNLLTPLGSFTLTLTTVRFLIDDDGYLAQHLPLSGAPCGHPGVAAGADSFFFAFYSEMYR